LHSSINIDFDRNRCATNYAEIGSILNDAWIITKVKLHVLVYML